MLAATTLALSLGFSGSALATPTGGTITAGSGQITQSGNTTTIQQTSQNLSLSWQSFDVASQQTVNFVQPGANALAVNRIFSASASEILGHLNSNGQVWLINPNGVLFGQHAQVNVGGLVASTLDTVGDNSTGSQKFSGTSQGPVINQGTITAASGGYVALLGHHVSNQGIISAQLGTVALGAGSAQTLTFNGNHLLHLQVDASQLDDLVENRQLIQANGGQVFMTAGAKDAVLASVVNNTGFVQAETVENHNGTIVLLAGGAGTVNVDGTLDASAPRGGDGGSIETSGATVNIASTANVRANAPSGRSGTWLVDPVDLTIDTGAASAIEQTLNTGTSVTEQTTSIGASGSGTQSTGAGDINVQADITWSSAAATLTLDAFHGINVTAPVNGAGQVVMKAGSGDLTLNSTVSGQAGVSLSTAGGKFINNAGTSAISVGSGARWLVYSTNPTLDTTGGLQPDFIQYAASAGTTPTPSTGSGFLYSVAPTLSVTALSGTVTKTYDGTTTAAVAGSNMTVSGLLNGDTVTSLGGTYGSADAGTGINVTSSTDAATLVIANGSIPIYGYGLGGSAVTAAVGTISPKQLTASIVGTPTKTYDGTTTATLNSGNYSFFGFVSGQSATVSQPSTVGFASADASQNAVVNATFTSTNFTPGSGTNLANYILPTTATGAGIINQAPVNLTGLLAMDKTYDGTNAASLNTSNAGIFGVIAPDAGSVWLDKSGAAATYSQSNAGTNLAVTVTPGSFQLTGTKAANYTLIAPGDLQANIGRLGLTLNGVAGTNKVYDGNTSDPLDFSGAALMGVLAGDRANVVFSSAAATGTFNFANAATGIGVTVTGVTLTGSAANNYSIAQPTGITANITPKPLTITLGGNQVKPYNGTQTATVEGTDFTIFGFVGTESAAITQNALAQYSTPNAGTNIPVTATLEASDFTPAVGTLMSNYSFSHTVTGNTGTINPIPLSAYITNNPTKTYDGNRTATVTSADYVLTGFVGSESATVTQPNATYAAPDAGSEMITAAVTSANFTAGGGTLISNYILPSTISGPGTIQPLQLGGNYIYGSIVGNPTKVYDGTTVANLTPANFQLTGFVSGQGATVTQTSGTYSNANVGTQSITAQLAPEDFTANAGTNLANYRLPTAVYGSGTITPAPLTVSIVGNPTKVYDGTTTTALLPSNYQVTGFVAGQGATITPSSLINYDSKDVGSRNITADLTASAYTPTGGTLMSNYTLATSATGPGEITPAPLYVIGVAANNRTYNGTTAATLNISNAGLGGLVTGESSFVTLNTTTSGTFAQADVANGISVSTTGFSISGTGASNYSLQPVTGLHANITPAPLTIQQVTANNKSYDGTAQGTLSTGSAALQGVFGTDNVTLDSSGATATFASANAGAGIPVSASGFALSGTKAFDYSLSQPTELTAAINPAVIHATIIGDPTKQYDGSNSATLTSADYQLTGFASGQGATVPQSATANYLSANAGDHIGLESTLVISDFVPNTGTNLANYVMPSTASGTLGTITPKILNLTGTRVYDTTTDASGTLFGTLTGLNGDTLTVTGTGTLLSKNVGTQNFQSLGNLSLSANGSALATNYTLVGGIDWVKITPATLTVTGTTGSSKTYDGNTSATISGATLNGVLGSDDVTLANNTSGNFTDKNVGANKTIITAMTVNGGDAGNYTLVQPTDAKGSITAQHITVTATGRDKVYDATTSDNPDLTSSDLISGDTVSFTGTATFDTANVGTGKTVSVINIGKTGADAGNYILDNSTASTTAAITPKILNLQGTRVYDATTNADASLFGNNGTLTGVAGQTLILTGTGTLSLKDVNSQQSFASLLGFTLSDGTGLASNYKLAGGTDWVNITPAPLTVINTAVTAKPYDGNANATLTGATLQGVLGSDHVLLGDFSSGTFSDKNVGDNKTVTTLMTISDTDAHNYTLTQPTLTGSIYTKTITVTASGVSKYYDGTTSATVNLTSTDLAPGDTLTFADTSATFADKNAGTGISIDVQGIHATGTGASNYTLGNSTATTSADINKLVINLSGTRVYNNAVDADAALFAPGGVLATGIGGETLILTGSGVLASKNVNTAQPFSSLGSLNLADGTNGGLASNYTLVNGTDTVNITPFHLTVTATGANKTYDGGVLDPGVTLAAAGIYAGNDVTLSDTSAKFADKDAQTGKTVTVSGISLSGADKNNYTLDNTSTTTTADITPKTLTITASASDKIYDGTNIAFISGLTAGTGGIVSGDDVTINRGAATYSDANASGSNKTVTVVGLNLTGTDASNYLLSSPVTTTGAKISPLALNLIGTRIYDGSTEADASLFSLGGVLSTGIGTETLVLTGSGVLTLKDVNSAQTFSSLGTLHLADGTNGGIATNYTLSGGTDKVNITPLHITVAAQGANKVYDGNVLDPGLTLGSASVIAGDQVTFAATSANFADKTAQDGKTVTVNGISISGGTDRNNYIVDNAQATTTANITKRPLTVSITGTDKPYDGSANDAVAFSAGTGDIVGGDTVLIGALSTTFSDANAGDGKTVTASGLNLSGADALNYSLTSSIATTTADISRIVLSLTGTRVYNGLTTADASLFGTNGTLSTGVNNETVILTGTGTLSFKDVNSQQSFADLSGFTLGNGTGLASNYTLSGGTDWVNITPLHITAAAQGANKVYDGNTSTPGLTLGSGGVMAGDSLTFADTSATFSDKNAGNSKTITVSGLSISSGNGAGDYILDNSTATTTANITPKPLTVGITASDKTYDGSSNATIGFNVGAGAIVSGDSVSIGASSATFANANAGIGKIVTASGLNLTGTDADNYLLTGNTATATATISPVVLSLTGARTYNGLATADASLFGNNGTLSTGVNDETVVLTGTGTLVGKDVNPQQAFQSLTGFTLGDGTGLAGNYTLSGGTDWVNITPLHITVAAQGANKVYDGNTSTPGLTLGSSGVITGDSLTFADTSATFADKNAGNGKAITVSGLSISSGNGAGDYILDNSTTTTTANITPMSITVAATGTNKVYDATTNDTVSLTSGQILVGDDVSFSAGSALFGDKNVGNAKTVSVSGITASGNDAGNYSYNNSATTAANITPAPLTVLNTQAANKVYDGNSVASLSGATLSGIQGNDDVTLGNFTTGAFSDANAGTAKTVSTAMTLGGADVGNYTFTQPTGLTANISQAVLNLTATRQYDGTANAAAALFGNSGELTGVNGETLTLGGTGLLNSKNVNPAQSFSDLSGFSLSGNGGALASNYTLTGGTDWVKITPAPLTILGAQANNKVYDGTTVAALTGATLSGIMGTDDVTLGNSATGTFSDKNVGTGKVVTAAMTVGGTDASNYTFTQPTGLTANITQRNVTVAATGTDKVYDGNTLDQVTLSATGLVAGDAVTVANTSATFGDKNVGNAKTVNVGGITLSGTDASNYSYNTTATTAASITPRAVTVTATAQNKVYDGNTNDPGTTLAATGILAGDTVSFTDASATFDDKNVGNGKNVTVRGISGTGTDAGNYSYNTLAVSAANITPAPLTVTGTTTTNRAYDGTVADALSGATLAGVVSGDSVTLGNDTTGTFENKNAGSGKTVSTAMTISGADAGNYTLAQPTGLIADVTAKTITVAATGTNKVYDGNTGDKVSLASNGIVNGDDVTFTNSGANFSDAIVGNNKTVTASGIRIAGVDAGNYALASDTATTTANITSGTGVQDTAVAVGYLELSPDAIATPYGVAPSDSPGQLTGNKKRLHRAVEANTARVDFQSGLALQVVDGGVRMPAQ